MTREKVAELFAAPWQQRELVWAVDLPIKCVDCGHESAVALAMLRGAQTMHCEQCGAELDLSDDKVAATITKLWNICEGERVPIAPTRRRP